MTDTKLEWPTEAEPDFEVEWVEGSTPDLTEREKLLIRNAYADGYADGERHGYKVGGQEALHAATTLSTLMASPLWDKNLETLRYFQELAQ